MDEHPLCPQCEHENPLGNRFCGRCGASLTSSRQIVPRHENTPAAVVRALPAKLGPTGKVLLVGLATLAAEAGLLWLRRRVERTDRPPVPAAQDPKPAVPDYLISQSLEEVYVWLQEGDHQGRILARKETRSLGTTRSTDVRG
jgi:hypothetical protein